MTNLMVKPNVYSLKISQKLIIWWANEKLQIHRVETDCFVLNDVFTVTVHASVDWYFV